MTIPNQVSLHKRLHPTHAIRVIESDDYDRYGFKIRTTTYQLHKYRYPSSDYSSLLGELFEYKRPK